MLGRTFISTLGIWFVILSLPMRGAVAAGPCSGATQPSQCASWSGASLPPFVLDAITIKGGTVGAGEVLVLTSGDPGDSDDMLSTPMGQLGCGANPDGWDTYDCVRLQSFVPTEDSLVLALSSEWFEWYQTSYTDWMTISGAGVAIVDVSINAWIDNKVDILPYGPNETGVVILTSLAASKMVDFRVADSGDSIYDTAILVVPAAWFGSVTNSNADQTLLCGNGVLDPGEECDDGNTITDDGCSSVCLGLAPPTAGTEPPMTCGNLHFVWPTGAQAPYTCGSDLCLGFRCVIGDTISPACFTASQCAAGCGGLCLDVQAAQQACATLCAVQPPATEPPPVLPPTCDKLVYLWADGATMPYGCNDACVGERCVTGATIDPQCYEDGGCDASTCPDGVCVITPAPDCNALCALAALPTTCTASEQGHTRIAANQTGPCLGNLEICKSHIWKLADGAHEPDDEKCNGVDDDCNGSVDDMYETCGDPGLCQNTVNTCDPANPTVPVPCVPLAPPSPVEICNDGLDNDCDGSPDDGCKCGDDECMPGESFFTCPGDCPPPPNGTACEDGDLCTVGDTFQNGSCIPGVPATCVSGNGCVIAGACNPSTGCSATKLDCDDADPCTLDDCEPTVGCINTPDPACQGVDADGDGHLSEGSGGDDCDDTNGSIHPGAAEICNGVDDNCNGFVDEGQGLCTCPVDGDLSGDAQITVVDVQCSILVALWSLGGGASPPPACLANGQLARADLNCDVVTNIVDVVLTIDLVLGVEFSPEIDADGDGCVDTCEAPN